MCWCIGRAATQVKEFYMLPVGDKLIRYDSIAVNTIVANSEGEVSSCDIPFSDDLSRYHFRSITPRWLVPMQPAFLTCFKRKSLTFSYCIKIVKCPFDEIAKQRYKTFTEICQ